MYNSIDFKLDIEHRSLNVLVEYKKFEYSEIYGSDYDGNRGQMRDYVEISDLKIFDLRNNDLTYRIKTNYPYEYEYLINYLERNEI